MEDYNNIIEGILYLKGDEGIDIKELSLILEISKKEAVEAMDHFIEAYSKRGFDGLQVVDFGGKYKLATNPQYFPYYQKLVEQSKNNTFSASFMKHSHYLLIINQLLVLKLKILEELVVMA